MTGLAQEIARRGMTDAQRIVDESALAPIQEALYATTRELLEDHDPDLPVAERINLPFKKRPDTETWNALCSKINAGPELGELIHSEAVLSAFEGIFGEAPTAFPISKFRANFPALKISNYAWHQDEGTWFAVKNLDLADKSPVTLWLSLNGADARDSIELVEGSHDLGLKNHFFIERQGYFNAKLPAAVRSTTPTAVCCAAGEGVFFHPLLFHRSISNVTMRPRYSVDIRYHGSEGRHRAYKVDVRFRLKRLYYEFFK